MSKFLIFLVLSFILNITISAQTWQPKYSVNNLLSWDIHGYQNEAANGPWAVADSLMKPSVFNNYQMGMMITSSYVGSAALSKISANSAAAPIPATHLFVETTGALFEIYNDKIVVTQILGMNRQLLTISFWNNTTQITNINYNAGLQLSGAQHGRVYFNDTNTMEFRINGDGLIMIKPSNSGLITKVKYEINFYPGYKADSPKIPHGNSTTVFNKSDVSHLFIDEYGGFGVYLLDNEKEFYNTTGAFPSAEYSLTKGKIFWTAVFPPKSYDFNKDFDNSGNPKKTYAISWYSYIDNNPSTDWRPVEKNWNSAISNPIETYGLVSNSEPIALKNYVNTNLINPKGGLKEGMVVHFGDLTLWKDWNFGYTPRKNLISNDGFSLLKKISDNLHDPSINSKYIVYTSPQYFLKGSRYKQSSPYTFEISNDIGDINYDGMLSDSNNFIYDVGEVPLGFTKVKVPLLNHYNMLWYRKDRTSKVDNFMKTTNWPSGSFMPGSREGENWNYYLSAINDLKVNMGSSLDGIYMDTFYEFNIPRTYQLMRTLKQKYTDNFILFRHASGKEGQDAYLPQIDSYGDYVLTGEGNNHFDYYDRKFWRFFISTYNISNSVAILDQPQNITPGDATFRNWLYDYNIKLWYPSIKKSGNADPGINNQCLLVDDFWTNYPTKTNLINQINNNLTFHQPTHQSAYNYYYAGNNNIWYQSTPIASSANDICLTGDFNGDKRKDIAVYINGSWNIYSNWQNINTTFSLGGVGHIPLTGDFNGDGKDDILTYLKNYNNNGNIVDLIQVCQTHGDFNSLKFSTINPKNPDGTDKPENYWWQSIPIMNFQYILSGDFNGDGKDDILFKNNGSIKVLLSDAVSGFWDTSLSNCPENLEFNDFTDLNYTASDIPFIGDFNGDGKDDIGIRRISGSNTFVYVCLSSGITFGSASLWKTWVGKVGKVYAGKFDASYWSDVILEHIPQVGGGVNYYAGLSNKTNAFVDPSPTWSLGFGSDGNKTFTLDLNGDGIDDIGKYQIGVTTPIAVKFIKNGEIRSNTTGLLPKLSGITTESEPLEFKLNNNYPNPFNPTTTISFSLKEHGIVNITVYDILGRQIKEIVNNYLERGDHSFIFDGSSLSSGIYYYRLQVNNFVQTKKFTLMK